MLKAVEEKACTGIIIKPNQIGTVSETVEVVKIARDAGWQLFFTVLEKQPMTLLQILRLDAVLIM